MELRNRIRKSVELGISMTIIATMVAACGGGGGGGVASSNLAIGPAVPALGAFVDGATVIVYDKSGKECARNKTAGGSATVTIDTNTCSAPLTVQAGIPGDQYFDESLGANRALTASGVRAVLPAALTIPFGVTTLTEIAAMGLLNASGVVNTNASGVTARNNAVAALLGGGNVPDPLAVPQAASLTTKAANAYGALLATLANLVPGQNAEKITRDLAKDMLDNSWDGVIGTGTAASTPAATPGNLIFGASMAAAATTASAVQHINAASAPTITFLAAYQPAGNVASAVAATAANGNVPPIQTARNLFTSLRTSMVQLTNPTQTGFFDKQLTAAKADLGTAMPQIQKTLDKIRVMNDAISLMDNLKATGLPACIATTPGTCWGTFQIPDPVTPGNVRVQSITYNPVGMMWRQQPQTCTTTSHPQAQFAAGALPTGISVTCDAEIDQRIFTATGYNSHTFKVVVTPATANNFTYTSSTVNQPFDFMGVPGTATTGNTYTGTTSVVRTASGQMVNSTVSGMLVADAVSHAYDQVAINMTRTYPSGTVPVGIPQGFALAKYDATGSIASHQAGSTIPLGTVSLLTGSSYSKIEDANGLAVPNTATAVERKLAMDQESLTAVLQAKTARTQLDGTATASKLACDLSGFYCNPTSMSFTGSMTNLADAAVGKFATGTLSVTRDFAAYTDKAPMQVGTAPFTYTFMGQAPLSATNFIKDKGVFSGTVTNSTVTPAAVYRVTLNEDRTVYNQNTVSFIYIDSLNTTVNGNAVLNTALGAPPAQNFNVTSGAVIANLTRIPPALGAPALSGLTGNVYVGAVAQPNLIGTILGNRINYIDGTFSTLQ